MHFTCVGSTTAQLSQYLDEARQTFGLQLDVPAVRPARDGAVGQPLVRMTQWLREVRTGAGPPTPNLPVGAEFEPFTQEVSRLASSFTAAKAAAEEEARLRDSADSHWTTDRLRVFVQGRLGDFNSQLSRGNTGGLLIQHRACDGDGGVCAWGFALEAAG